MISSGHCCVDFFRVVFGGQGFTCSSLLFLSFVFVRGASHGFVGCGMVIFNSSVTWLRLSVAMSFSFSVSFLTSACLFCCFGPSVTASRLGQSVDQPFCGEPQRETAPLLLASPGSPGCLRGCVSSSLGRPGSLRVPSLSSDRSGDHPCPRVIACRNDSGRTPLAREGVVRRPASTDPTASRPALVGKPASTAPLQPLPPRRLCAETSHVATLQRHFRKSGLFGKGCSSLVRVPQILHLAPLPVEVADLLWLVSWKGRCSSQRHCSSSRGLSDTLTPRQGLVRLCP